MVCRARSRLAHLCQGPRAQVPRAQVNLCVKLIFSINPKELSMNDSVNTAVEEFSDEEYGDLLETVGESHRMAAFHFKEASKQHELAASAFDLGDHTACDMHAFMAYRHQLNAVQYAEIAVMDIQGLDEIEE